MIYHKMLIEILKMYILMLNIRVVMLILMLELILVLEKDDRAFGRATYVNQARVHMGYHYPRSLSTATKSAGYFRRFCDDFPFCIEKGFHQIYATSSRFSWTNAEQFQSFCKAAGIRCEEAPVSLYFKEGMCDGAFLTEEYTYDAMILKKYFLDALSAMPNVTICYNAKIEDIARYPPALTSSMSYARLS